MGHLSRDCRKPKTRSNAIRANPDDDDLDYGPPDDPGPSRKSPPPEREEGEIVSDDDGGDHDSDDSRDGAEDYETEYEQWQRENIDFFENEPDDEVENKIDYHLRSNLTRVSASEGPLIRSMAARRQEPAATDLLFVGNLNQNVNQPVRDSPEQNTLTGSICVNGVDAIALLDTGSNTDIISADFVRASGLKSFPLDTPLNLHMACIGSRTKLSQGVNLEIQTQGTTRSRYFDIANIDGYDMIVGLPFLTAAKAVLDFSGERPTFELRGFARSATSAQRD